MRNRGFNKKILLSGLIFMTATLVISALGITALSRLVRSNDGLVERYNLERSISPLEHFLKKIAALEAQSILEPSSEKSSVFPKRISDAYSEWNAALSTLSARLSDATQQNRLSELRSLIDKRKELSGRILNSALDGDVEQAFALHNPDELPARSLDEDIRKISSDLIQSERAAALQQSRENSAEGRLWIYWMSLLSAASLACTVLLSQTLLASIRKSLNRTGEALADSVEEIHSMANSAAQAVNKISETAAAEASSLEELSATVGQMVLAVNANAEHSKLFAHFTNEFGNDAARARAFGDEVSFSFSEFKSNNTEIMRQIQQSCMQLEEVGKLFADFSEKAKLMNEFVLKTKLLSFNASLEAARAGENGRGFSMIADELTDLAQTCSAAAKEINAMLSDRSEQAEKMVRESCAALEEITHKGLRAGENAAGVVEQCKIVLQEISENSVRMTRFAQELRQASEAQALGLNELGKTIQELEEMSRQSSASTDSCAASADELVVRSENLKALTKTFLSSIREQKVLPLRARSSQENQENGVQQGDGVEPTEEQQHALNTRSANTGKDPKPSRMQRSGQRSRSEEYMRKAAGAEDIPFESDSG